MLVKHGEKHISSLFLIIDACVCYILLLTKAVKNPTIIATQNLMVFILSVFRSQCNLVNKEVYVLKDKAGRAINRVKLGKKRRRRL